MNYVILGNGIAGLTALEELLKYKNTQIDLQEDTQETMKLTIISEEAEPAYLRPLLSKTYIKSFQKEKIRIKPESWYEENGIRQILGKKIEKISVEEKQIVLEGGEAVPYDKCIYALGARSFVPSFLRQESASVMTVRNVSDFDRIRRKLYMANSAIVIGGGVIGLEMAWELAQMNCKVTVLEAADHLMGRILDEETAKRLRSLMEAQGIEVETKVSITQVEEKDRKVSVTCLDGLSYQADFALISCGVRPNIELAKAAGIDCDRGVLVDKYMQTSCVDIYAAGDCIQANDMNPYLWTYARESAMAAGYNICHDEKIEKKVDSYPVLLHAFHTTVYSDGAFMDADEVIREEKKSVNKNDMTAFFVNPPKSCRKTYVTKFYKNKTLCGMTMIGEGYIDGI